MKSRTTRKESQCWSSLIKNLKKRYPRSTTVGSMFAATLKCSNGSVWQSLMCLLLYFTNQIMENQQSWLANSTKRRYRSMCISSYKEGWSPIHFYSARIRWNWVWNVPQLKVLRTMITLTLMTSSLRFWLKRRLEKLKKCPAILAPRKRWRKPRKKSQPLKRLSCD